MPLCRTPSYEGRGGASTVPCALTMTAAGVTMVAAARAQPRNRATVSRAHPPRWRRGHDERRRAHDGGGAVTMTTSAHHGPRVPTRRLAAAFSRTSGRCACSQTVSSIPRFEGRVGWPSLGSLAGPSGTRTAPPAGLRARVDPIRGATNGGALCRGRDTSRKADAAQGIRVSTHVSRGSGLMPATGSTEQCTRPPCRSIPRLRRCHTIPVSGSAAPLVHVVVTV